MPASGATGDRSSIGGVGGMAGAKSAPPAGGPTLTSRPSRPTRMPHTALGRRTPPSTFAIVPSPSCRLVRSQACCSRVGEATPLTPTITPIGGAGPAIPPSRAPRRRPHCLRLVLQQQLSALLADHDGGRIDVARGHRREDRRIDDP